ncbi:unnamed protein product [Protopolystoma xenopodis]|uniref:BRCA2 OB1 domain-containing protein n=1 Tax=Protopolystoma xenopodis TaxID=117903 RepID=A0A3S5FE65_9PLAT|nr:unnamed protein product [Protopolystoma xenopodis]
MPDPFLCQAIRNGRLRVGTKVMTAGSDLINDPTMATRCPGNQWESESFMSSFGRKCIFDHLLGAAEEGVCLRIHGNSTRRVHPNSRLGFFTFISSFNLAHLPSVPLSSLSPSGGSVSKITVLIQAVIRSAQLIFTGRVEPDLNSPRFFMFVATIVLI